jgi:hypothetical protein
MDLRTWVALGARLNAQGVVEAIPWQEWQKLREELRGLEAKQIKEKGNEETGKGGSHVSRITFYPNGNKLFRPFH